MALANAPRARVSGTNYARGPHLACGASFYHVHVANEIPGAASHRRNAEDTSPSAALKVELV